MKIEEQRRVNRSLNDEGSGGTNINSWRRGENDNKGRRDEENTAEIRREIMND